MSQKKQRVAIAEAVGGVFKPCACGFCDGEAHRWHWPDGPITDDCPDYPNSLGDMYEAVETLRHKDGPEWFDFQKHLMDICGSTMNCIQATAAQRAESFLKTLGLWTEEE